MKRLKTQLIVSLSSALFASGMLAATLFSDPSILQNSNRVMLATVVCTAVASLITFLGAMSLLERRRGSLLADAKRLEERLAYIGKGNYNIYLETTENSGLGTIAQTVNHLTARVTEMERRLETERRKTEYILDNMDSGLIMVDASLMVRQCNSSIYKYFTTAEEIVGEPLSAVSNHPGFIKSVQDAVEREISSVFDIDLTASTGAIVSVRINPVVGEWIGEDSSISAVIILTNVTQVRRMESLRSEFVANVSHELKTPITSIKGFTELIQTGVVSDPAVRDEYIGRIGEEAQRMTYLIDDILRLSSLESKQTEEIYDRVDLRSLCEDIFISLSPIMARKGIEHEIVGSASYVAYPDDMRQLLKNLLENAVKYNRENGRVTVRLVPDAYSCAITVSDTGIGIPIEHQSRIFERFYRVDKGRSKREGGTGLGLSIVKHIAAKYGGQITLVSRPDEGSSIRVTLPVEQKGK